MFVRFNYTCVDGVYVIAAYVPTVYADGRLISYALHPEPISIVAAELVEAVGDDMPILTADQLALHVHSVLGLPAQIDTDFPVEPAVSLYRSL